MTATTVAILLAAGRGRRYSGATHKLLAPLNGKPVAQWAIDSALDARIGPVVVVTGAINPVGDPSPDQLISVTNPDWADGQATSVTVGLRTAHELGARAAVIGLADQPFISPQAWQLVAASTAPIAIATYDGQRRNPVRLADTVWPLVPTTGDVGARSVAAVHPELVAEIPCPGLSHDIDTREDLVAWQNRSSTSSP